MAGRAKNPGIILIVHTGHGDTSEYVKLNARLARDDHQSLGAGYLIGISHIEFNHCALLSRVRSPRQASYRGSAKRRPLSAHASPVSLVARAWFTLARADRIGQSHNIV